MKRIIIIGSIIILAVVWSELTAQTANSATGYYHYYFWLADGTKKYFVSDVMEYEKLNSKHYMETLRVRYPEIIKVKSSGSFNPVIPHVKSKEDLWQKSVEQRIQNIESARKNGYQIIEVGILNPTIKTQNPSAAKPY